MSKKINLLGYAYFIGMALVVIGYFLPLGSFLGLKGTMIKVVTDGTGAMHLGAILILAGSVAGIVICFVNDKFLYKLICLALSAAGFAYIYLNTGSFAKAVGKFVVKNSKPGLGAVLIIAGLVIAVAGLFIKRRK